MPLFFARLLRQRDRLRRLTALLLLSRRETPLPNIQSSLKAVEFPVSRLGGFLDVATPATETPPTAEASGRPYTTLGSWPMSTNGNAVTLGPGRSEAAKNKNMFLGPALHTTFPFPEGMPAICTRLPRVGARAQAESSLPPLGCAPLRLLCALGQGAI